MFTNKSFDTVGFDSQVSVAKPEVSTNVQTTEIVYSSNQIQTVEKRSVETQTVQEEPKIPSVDYSNLAKFLKRVTPKVLKALEKTYNTTAFDDYNPGTSTNTPANLQLLAKLNTTEESEDILRNIVSDLSWSIAGGTLAVSYMKLHRVPHCDHSTKIDLYSLSIEDKLSDAPSKRLEVNSCVVSLSYHPAEPSILAAGLMNGNVLIWDLRNDDSVIPTKVCTHGEKITCIRWNASFASSFPLLVSSSLDGYIIVHRVRVSKNIEFFNTRLFKRFKLILENKPEVGQWITTFDFSCQNSTIFIVGTIIGRIYQCSLNGSLFKGEKDLYNPVVSEYDNSERAIQCVKCSPTRDLFLAYTASELRIYNFDQSFIQHFISIEYDVFGLTWMVGNQDIFAAYGSNATIEFYNVTNGKAMTNVKIKEPDTNGAQITSLCVNSKRDVLAFGDIEGNIEVWRVPRQLF